MSASLTAIVYLAMAIAAGALLADRCFPGRREDIFRIALCWIALTVLMFLTPSAPLFMFSAGAILIFAAPREPVRRLMFFCAMLPAAPSGLVWQIPFPGVEYLMYLSYAKLVNLTVLVPMLLAPSPVLSNPAPLRSSRLPLHFAVAYLLLTIALDFRSTTVTNGMRFMVDNVLMTGVLLVVMPKTLRQENGLRELIFGLMIAGIFLAFIGVVQHLLSWPIYPNVSGALRLYELAADMIYAYRDGSLRISGTMSTAIAYGMYMAITAGLLLFQQQIVNRRKWSLLAVGLALFGLYVSYSRGAMLLFAVICGVYVFFSPRMRPVRSVLLVGVVVIGGSLLSSGVLDEIISADEHGTFQYRIELMENAGNSIRKHPILGTPDFLSDESMQQSMQGQGIVDVVNAYLGVVLQYGFVGLILFVSPLILLLASLAKRRSRFERDRLSSQTAMPRLLLSVTIAYAVAIATVSLIDRLDLYYWVILCMAYAAANPGLEAANGDQGVAKRV